MDSKELEARIDKANAKFVTGEDAGGETPAVPTDLYKRNAWSARAEQKKRRPNGSASIVKAVTRSVLTGDGQRGAGLSPAFKRAKDDSDFFRKRGECDRAEIVRNQYMEDNFLPAVEAIIAYSSPDELLNCPEALNALDKFVMGIGSTKGYTAQYIRSAYGNALGEDYAGRTGRSDDYVKRMICRIKMLADGGSNREAISLAVTAKKDIDGGSHIASDEDYELIGRVAAYAG